MNSADLARIRRARDRESAALVIAAIRAGTGYRMTAGNGVMLFGPKGSVTTHLNGTDHRRSRNFKSLLTRAGITT